MYKVVIDCRFSNIVKSINNDFKRSFCPLNEFPFELSTETFFANFPFDTAALAVVVKLSDFLFSTVDFKLSPCNFLLKFMKYPFGFPI